jgi:uncharacterized protein (UPF0335 family)
MTGRSYATQTTHPHPSVAGPDIGVGHNREKLCEIVQRIESIEQERAELAADVKDILAEVRSAGFDVRVVRQIVRLRRQDKDERCDARQAIGAGGLMADYTMIDYVILAGGVVVSLLIAFDQPLAQLPFFLDAFGAAKVIRLERTH